MSLCKNIFCYPDNCFHQLNSITVSQCKRFFLWLYSCKSWFYKCIFLLDRPHHLGKPFIEILGIIFILKTNDSTETIKLIGIFGYFYHNAIDKDQIISRLKQSDELHLLHLNLELAKDKSVVHLINGHSSPVCIYIIKQWLIRINKVDGILDIFTTTLSIKIKSFSD